MSIVDELMARLDQPPAEDKGDLMIGNVSWANLREICDKASDEQNEWQGIPVPVPGLPLRLHDRHFMADRVNDFQRNLDAAMLSAEEIEIKCRDSDMEEGWHLRNSFYVSRIGKRCNIYQHDGKIVNMSHWESPDRSMDRLNLWLQTVGASDGWDHDAERRARSKLRGMVTARAYRHYDLTGSFFETSPRSGLTYVFRRLRPTIVLSPRPSEAMRKRGDENMRCLCVLCLHPIGYYEGTWAGCMVPTDDVIAHLSLMRGDEAHYWGQANQHAPSSPEAGL